MAPVVHFGASFGSLDSRPYPYYVPSRARLYPYYVPSRARLHPYYNVARGISIAQLGFVHRNLAAETCYFARPPPPGPDTTTGTLGGIHTLQSTLETLALHYKQLKFRSEPPEPVGTQAIRSVRARVRLKSYFRAAPGASGYQNTYYQCKDMSGDGQIFKCKFSSLRSGSTAQSHHCGATPQSRHFDSFSTQSMSDTVWM